MAKVTTPQGEEVLVRRRWFPWPNLADSERLEAWGVSDNAVKALAKNGRADYVALGALLFIPLMAFLAGATAVFMVSVGLILITFTVCYLALPWRIEVVHKGTVVESEKSDGYSMTTNRIEKVAALYRSGGLKLPQAPRNPVPEKTSQIPLPPPAPPVEVPVEKELPPQFEIVQQAPAPLPEPEPEPVYTPPAVISRFDVPEDDPMEAAFAPPVLKPQPEPVVEAHDRGPVFSGESPLRRAIRLMEEEERALEAQGVHREPVKDKDVKRAQIKQSRRRH